MMGRFLAAMRVSPTRDPWLQSAADREVAADDWARVVDDQVAPELVKFAAEGGEAVDSFAVGGGVLV